MTFTNRHEIFQRLVNSPVAAYHYKWSGQPESSKLALGAAIDLELEHWPHELVVRLADVKYVMHVCDLSREQTMSNIQALYKREYATKWFYLVDEDRATIYTLRPMVLDDRHDYRYVLVDEENGAPVLFLKSDQHYKIIKYLDWAYFYQDASCGIDSMGNYEPHFPPDGRVPDDSLMGLGGNVDDPELFWEGGKACFTFWDLDEEHEIHNRRAVREFRNCKGEEYVWDWWYVKMDDQLCVFVPIVDDGGYALLANIQEAIPNRRKEVTLLSSALMRCIKLRALAVYRD